MKKRQAWTQERRNTVVILYSMGWKQKEIAQKLGSSQSKVQKALVDEGIQSRSRGDYGKGKDNYFWNGGRSIDEDGYVLIYAPDHPYRNRHNQVREHRLVMESKLGRYLKEDEVVHHRNGISDDNRIENLELFATNADHLRHEFAGRCPNWSPEGRARILKAVRKQRKHKLQHRSRKSDDY